VIGAILVALWLAAAAIYENVRFADTSGQLLSLIATAQDMAAKDSDFDKRAGEDLLADLRRLAQIQDNGSGPKNAWHQAIHLTAPAPSITRLETDVPAPACRRLALFFGKDAHDLKLQAMEARGENGVWRRFFDGAAGSTPNYAMIDAACGSTGYTTLALILALR
jgi:hypothetical protein